ncbi:MAG: hypothetical protein JXX29_03435 [Deltaproteobacteria bacterium]|nr:hypothetical protein [Deltaproteobacteria bacterium]
MKFFSHHPSVPPRPSIRESAASISPLLSDAEARRKHAVIGAATGLVLQLLFAFFIGGSEFTLENQLDLSSAALLAGVLYLLTRTRRHQAGYRLGIFTIIYICSYTISFPEYDTRALIQLFYVAPSIMFFTLGIREGLIWLSISSAPMLLFQLSPSLFHRSALSTQLLVSFWACLGTISALAIISEWLRQQNWKTYSETNAAFQSANAQLNQLEGLIPICCYCKKIRDDDGYWRKVETFLAEHAHAHISSGICDNCAQKDTSLKETSEFPIPHELMTLFNWRHTIDETQRKYIQYAVALGIPVMWAFLGRDLVAGNYTSGIIQGTVSLIMVGIAFRIRKSRRVRLLYHATLFVLFIFLITPFFSPSPNGTEQLWFLLFPFAANLLLEFTATFIWTVVMFGFSLVMYTHPFFTKRFSASEDEFMYFIATYVLISVFTISMKHIRSLYAATIEGHVFALEQTYRNIRTVKGLVPICSACNAIRNDDGFWEKIDTYLLNHTELQLTHSICFDCLKREMPDVYEEMKSNGDL